MLGIHVDGSDELLSTLSTLDNLLEVTGVGDIIDWALEIFDDLGIGDDLIEVVAVVNTMLVDRTNKVLQLLGLLNYILREYM